MDTKICSKCKIKKPISEFSKGNSSEGFQSYCKKCQKEYTEEHKEQIKEYHKKYLKKPEILDNSIIGQFERICVEKISIRKELKASKRNIVFYEYKVGQCFKEKGFIVLKSGFPDFLIIDPTNKFGMFIEVKNGKDMVSENQKEYHRYLKMFGLPVNIVKNTPIEKINIEKLQKFFIPIKQQ